MRSCRRPSPSATTWVTPNDVLSISAVEFLRSRGVEVPRQKAVIGFDDSTYAYEYGVTSYNFDLIGITRDIFSYILNPSHSEFRSQQRKKECRGFIIEREST